MSLDINQGGRSFEINTAVEVRAGDVTGTQYGCSSRRAPGF